ncbi:DUF4235 domain-containing protein [Bifidobacterium sp. CP2]|uniref:DUF4235 domain-containing protein n=1 Tax=Bifidobacterium TaxID=1678 RepID=UPI001BDBBB15|nr:MULTISPECIES: DUF4235 domain-containing protein [Bifidobacterium]MBT1181984.1 DUF4235 domain-containing protein [Bifidobacterium sp. CP2]MBW3081306.1 DUF4235 domain-containing protein [Bifidobacterium saguinibicoloris]
MNAAKHRSTSTPSEADAAVEALHRIDRKVDALREQRLNDPDTLGDKLFTWALPSIAGLVAGKLLDTTWRRGTARRNLRKGLDADAPQGLLMSIAFAAVSAAVGAAVSQLADRGSKQVVARMQRRRRRRG